MCGSVVDGFAEKGGKLGAAYAAVIYADPRAEKQKSIAAQYKLQSELSDPNCTLGSEEIRQRKSEIFQGELNNLVGDPQTVMAGARAACEMTVEIILVVEPGLGFLEAAGAVLSPCGSGGVDVLPRN